MWKSIVSNRWLVLAWIAYLGAENVITSLSVIQEYARVSVSVEPWEVFLWEFSSGFMTFCLIPAIILYDRFFPLNFEQPLPQIAVQALQHLPATLGFCLIHVGGFIAIRKLIYSFAGRVYEFGNWPVELMYEYRKDVASYFTILAIIYVYRELRSLKEGKTKLDTVASEDQQSLKLIASKGRSKIVIAPNEIDSIEAAGNYVQLNVGSSSYLMRATMQTVADQLKSFNFSRVHRAHIVNEDKIVAALPKNNGGMILELQNGSKIECSRRYRQNLNAF